MLLKILVGWCLLSVAVVPLWNYWLQRGRSNW